VPALADATTEGGGRGTRLRRKQATPWQAVGGGQRQDWKNRKCESEKMIGGLEIEIQIEIQIGFSCSPLFDFDFDLILVPTLPRGNVAPDASASVDNDFDFDFDSLSRQFVGCATGLIHVAHAVEGDEGTSVCPAISCC